MNVGGRPPVFCSSFIVQTSSFNAMVKRLAGAMSLLAFAVCLVAGIEADNPPAGILSKALVAMAGTFVVALVVGAMGQKMLDEHLAAEQKKAAAAEAAAATGTASGADGTSEKAAG